MKILVFYPDTHYWAGKVGGGFTRFIETAKRFEGVQLHIITSKSDCNFLQNQGLKAHYHPYNFEGTGNLVLDIVLPIIYASNTALQLEDEFDVIYVPNDVLTTILPALLSKRGLKLPVAMVFQAGTMTYRSPDWRTVYKTYRPRYNLLTSFYSAIRDKIRIYIARRTMDLCIAVNNRIKDCLIQAKFNRERIFVNGNGLNLVKLNNMPSYGKAYDACYVSAISVWKGVFDLIEAWKNLVRNLGNELKLIIIGFGRQDDVRRLKETISRYQLDDTVEVAGFIEDSHEVFTKIKSSTLFILPTYGESWCLAIAEAMALGVPVITYDLPVFREIYPVGVVKVPVGDVDALEKAISLVLEDESMRRRLIEEGKRLVKKYDLDKVAEREREILSTLVR